MPPLPTLRPRAIGFLIATAALSSCRTPKTDTIIFQQLADAADQFAVMRQDIGVLNDTVDSLRTVVARQDSLIVKIAAASGVQIPR